MTTSEYHKDYWRRYKKTRRRVWITLSAEQYKDVEARAKEAGRKPGEQIWLESQAYQSSEYLPTKSIEAKLNSVAMILRGIANNINQMARHSNALKRMITERRVMAMLEDLEEQVTNYVMNRDR